MVSEKSDTPHVQHSRRTYQEDVTYTLKNISRRWSSEEREDMDQLLKKYKESTGKARTGLFSNASTRPSTGPKEAHAMFGVSLYLLYIEHIHLQRPSTCT